MSVSCFSFFFLDYHKKVILLPSISEKKNLKSSFLVKLNDGVGEPSFHLLQESLGAEQAESLTGITLKNIASARCCYSPQLGFRGSKTDIWLDGCIALLLYVCVYLRMMM